MIGSVQSAMSNEEFIHNQSNTVFNMISTHLMHTTDATAAEICGRLDV